MLLDLVVRRITPDEYWAFQRGEKEIIKDTSRIKAIGRLILKHGLCNKLNITETDPTRIGANVVQQEGKEILIDFQSH